MVGSIYIFYSGEVVYGALWEPPTTRPSVKGEGQAPANGPVGNRVVNNSSCDINLVMPKNFRGNTCKHASPVIVGSTLLSISAILIWRHLCLENPSSLDLLE